MERTAGFSVVRDPEIGAGGDNRNLFSGLEAQGTPYIPRPLTSLFCDAYSVVKDLL